MTNRKKRICYIRQGHRICRKKPRGFAGLGGTRASRVTAALKRLGLRSRVDSIDDNPGSLTRGEVVLWIGAQGYPVESVKDAIELVKRIG